jgi:hypothetical protein
VKIRVLSDLHLEHDEPLAIPYAEADLVVLAGDIHNHAEGLRWAAENFGSQVPVVYVPGNHEYYDGEFGALESAMQDAARSLPNVHFLNNTALTDRYGKWRVLGTTLWTDFALFGASDEAMRESDRSGRACDARLPGRDPGCMAGARRRAALVQPQRLAGAARAGAGVAGR